MAFHDPVDALSWALEVQHKLLLLPWPQQLLTQTDAQEECTPESLSLPKQALLLKGLRVRMAINTGVPDALQVTHTDTLHCRAERVFFGGAVHSGVSDALQVSQCALAGH